MIGEECGYAWSSASCSSVGKAGMQYARALSWIVIFISHCGVALSSFLNIRRLGQPNYGSVYKDGSFAIGRQPDFMNFAGIKHCLYCSRAQNDVLGQVKYKCSFVLLKSSIYRLDCRCALVRPDDRWSFYQDLSSKDYEKWTDDDGGIWKEKRWNNFKDEENSFLDVSK